MTVETLAAASTAGQTAAETADAVQQWWQSDLAQRWLIETPIGIGITLIVALVLHWLLRRGITKVANNSIKNGRIDSDKAKRRSKRRGKRADETDAQKKAREGRRVSRIRTLAGVARSAAAIVVWVWAALDILSKLGVNVAPLIASAGVIGVALGFGAQSLVKDFLSGIFMLLEDQYGIGDTIDLGDGIFGDVESISLRVTTVRDIDGALWYVRNGEILQVANHSSDYSVARLQIPVGLSNDTEAAGNVIEEAVKHAAKDDKIRDLVLAEPRVDGMSNFEPDYVSFRVSIRTMPGRQWDVQRFLQSRILNVMNAQGITTPYPHGIGIPDPRKEEEF
ncbi:Mechanosensitive ion channel [Corynebacterium camporealensis]|uniref:Mechanosensitive ion channel n=1 Tax=Corynebacterium camporealensis TaxID=161896 RepID=A0A0F6TC62_9CORY|nr:mechanosensitive ion channel family protein [Corynebacterium camporealensis]AKE39749.1 Mechanosensitive ion channel [Corynebacterium camporealensis]AVH88874.1 Mechanosensitive ion channel [Corynebacterium camporealensis]